MGGSFITTKGVKGSLYIIISLASKVFSLIFWGLFVCLFICSTSSEKTVIQYLGADYYLQNRSGLKHNSSFFSQAWILSQWETGGSDGFRPAVDGEISQQLLSSGPAGWWERLPPPSICPSVQTDGWRRMNTQTFSNFHSHERLSSLLRHYGSASSTR